MDGAKKIAVKMSDIIKKMGDHMPERFFGNYVFLATIMAKIPLHDGAAVQAVFLFSVGNMRHNKIFLKISTKNTSCQSFSLLNN